MKLKKLTISAMLVAVAVILSSFSIPIGPSRCFPIQHLCNVLAAVFLGPVYGVSMAFLHSTDQKSTRNRKPACVPWKYGWGICQCYDF